MISIFKIFKSLTKSLTSSDSSDSTPSTTPVVPKLVELKPPELPKTRRELKVLLKEKVVQIKTNNANGLANHNLFKENPNIDQSLLKKVVWGLRLSQDYRHHHIAYCELRGRTREQIEKPGKYNLPDEKKIQAVKEAYSGTIVYPRP